MDDWLVSPRFGGNNLSCFHHFEGFGLKILIVFMRTVTACK